MKKSIIAFTITFASLCISDMMPVIAYFDSSNIQIRFNEKEVDGSSRGRPSKRVGTGSRGECPPVKVPVTALIPTQNTGLTVEEHPTFWFFVPYHFSNTSGGEFALQDEANNDVYRTSFKLPETAGIVSLSVPSTVTLELNKSYQWYFKIYCSRQNFSNPVFVRGWVQREALKPDLERLLQADSNARSRIAIYAQNGIWYSALTELAKLYFAEPKNTVFSNDWANLLRDVDLENLAQQPIVGEVKNYR
ncbi:DUF928 domain-containing protein [Plectonema radiosum NIES-515]|uniref:DUF928 domain-containing protein n=1 Tax=Plectonema radiosum NIES-515 TaxID=2986073 RepID=A0ABT3B1A4_9CYAN|nr:DUF928 domain-containing protein [Plectonema radiosum]MCV3215152.1 DUF928 domain-containing protein [Plectonema radiosum NIES-515]